MDKIKETRNTIINNTQREPPVERIKKVIKEIIKTLQIKNLIVIIIVNEAHNAVSRIRSEILASTHTSVERIVSKIKIVFKLIKKIT